MPAAREKVLVLDDEQSILSVATRILSMEGYQVATALRGLEAVQMARSEHFDLLLTDVKMPGLSGLETYERIKGFDPDVVAVAMTGFGTMELAVEALTLGVSGFLSKPFDSTMLLETVNQALARKRLERENTRLRALIPLFELSRAFVGEIWLEDLLERIVRTAADETGADRSSLMMVHEERGDLTLQASVGLPSAASSGPNQRIGEGIAGWVAEHGEALILHGDPRQDPRFAQVPSRLGITSAVSVPLLFRDSTIGVLNLAKGPGAPPFAESDVELVTVLAGQAAAAIENARLFERTQRAFQQLAELDHMKSEFISIAAHELRTPLAIVVAYISLVEEQCEGTAKEHLRVALDGCGQLQSLIDVMVDLSHLESGALVLQPDEVRLRDVVDLALEEIRPLVDEKGHALSIDIPEDLPALVADKRKLTVVLSSLLSNAVKFTQSDGRIGVAAHAEDGNLIVSVTDNGCGIAEEDQQKVFDRFYQVASSLSREHGGLGLGLSIAKGIVELHGGFIWVDSQPDEGSTFRFRIPLKQRV